MRWSGLESLLIMFNTYTTAYWVGMINGAGSESVDDEMQNAGSFRSRIGVKPIPSWIVQLAVAYATADQKWGYGTDRSPGRLQQRHLWYGN